MNSHAIAHVRKRAYIFSESFFSDRSRVLLVTRLISFFVDTLDEEDKKMGFRKSKWKVDELL